MRRNSDWMFRWLALVAGALILAGCASTTLQSVWRDPAYAGGPFKRVFVVGLSAKDGTARRVLEDVMVAKLKAGGVDAVPGWQYLADGPLSLALADDVGRHCAQIGLDPALVGPLFFTCWMHRALKEAARLEPHRLATGRYARLLRLCLERRDAPGLRRLWGAAAG